MKDKAKADARKKAGGDNSSVDGSYSKAKGRKQERERETKKWRIGDYCRAIYPEDNLRYEAEIVHISGEKCIVCFLGYEDELEVNMNNLVPSRGKRSQNKQIKKAKKYFSGVVSSVDETESEVVTVNDSESATSQVPRFSRRRHDAETVTVDDSETETPRAPRSCRKRHDAEISCEHSPCAHVEYRQASTFPATPAVPPIPPMPMAVSSVPQIPPMPVGSDLSGNSALSAAMTAWYMAGYYTGFFEGQKQSQCVQRCGHNTVLNQPPTPPMPTNPDAATAPVLIAWYMAGYYTGFYETQNKSCGHHCGHTQKSSHDTHHAGHAARGYCHH
ncbi:survival motor neuron protein-like isoform X2 [Stegodyphus dumicola]|uniref:survival motor neuron protein-like isoform X2 n=1 Tax=Stegodyphus dumicola TaxID=202533 RepID=UPI0015A9AD65|nr:survival motor neuron protein-like isoform X2 [Stegodyphus dumicola]